MCAMPGPSPTAATPSSTQRDTSSVAPRESAIPARHGPRATTSRPTSDLLAAKLAVPQLPPGLVVRQRLMDRINDGVKGPVTLLSAGPGWGKTMLAANWATSQPDSAHLAWISLDPDDNDPAVFWMYLLAALRASGDVPSALSGLTVRPPMGPDLLRRIGAGIAELSHPVALVLDDFGEIRNPEVLNGVTDLLRHRTPLALVLLTRTDPHLDLHRLRVDDQLTDIRAADLMFTEAEAAELLHGAGIDLPPGLSRRLLDRTEGWAAGLRLAALFARGPRQADRIDEFAGDEGSVAEYLVEEVLNDLPRYRRQFLLRTSVVDRVCADLADVLCDAPGSQRSLEALEQANAFVVALAPGRRWFRYHPLMRDLLRHRLRLDHPDLPQRLHRRAALWFAERNEPVEAVRHAIHARDWQLVGNLVVTVAAARAVSADRQTFAVLLAEIPAHELRSSAELRVCGALRCFLVRDYAGFANHVANARAMLDRSDPSRPSPTEIFLCVADLVIARLGSDIQAIIEVTEKLLDLLKDPTLEGSPAAVQWEAPALSNLGVGLLWSGRRDEAEQQLRAAASFSAETDADLVMVNTLGHLALVEVGRGHLSAAAETASNAIDIAEHRGWTELAQTIGSYMALAQVELERYHLANAQHLLDSALAAQRNDPERLAYLALQTIQARRYLADGRLKQAKAALAAMRAEKAGPTNPRLLTQMMAIVEAEIDLASGVPASAIQRLEPLMRGDGGLESQMIVCAARARLSLGEYKQAEELSASVTVGSEHPIAAVEGWLVTALAADHDRDDHRALAALEQALSKAEPEGIRRPFVSFMNPRLRGMLSHRRGISSQTPFEDDLLAALDKTVPPAEVTPISQPLTDREQVVLSHLATMQTNEEIASELFVSINTVKAHARSVYRKLAVTNRREAVSRARELDLI